MVFGFAVRRFNKMPGHHAYDLSVKPVTAPRLTDDAEAYPHHYQARKGKQLLLAPAEFRTFSMSAWNVSSEQ